MSRSTSDQKLAQEVPPGFERRPRRLPLLLLGLVVFGAFFAVAFTMFTRSVVYYRTPTEVVAAPSEHVRISGTVVPGSIVTSVTEGTVSFTVTDEVTTVPILFEGPAPDTLKDNSEAVAEGILEPDGVFHADELFARCPSKFEAKTSPGG